MADAAPIKKVSARRQGRAQGAAGQLDRYDDGTWEFFGNGQTTTAEVAKNIAQFEKRDGNPDFERVKSDMLAQLLLDTDDNKQLKKLVAGDINKPIPKNSSLLAEGQTLQQLVGQLMAHEKALRESLIAQSQERATRSSQVLGDVRGGGLSLPYEP